jgi:hypothetical protein
MEDWEDDVQDPNSPPQVGVWLPTPRPHDRGLCQRLELEPVSNNRAMSASSAGVEKKLSIQLLR